jgi:hypothetical protein
MDIASGAMGPEANYDLSFSAGSLVIAVNYKGAQASASLNVSVSASQLVTALESKVSNAAEKAALEVVAAVIAGIQ